MVVFLDPIETGGWLGVLRDNGVAKDRRVRPLSRSGDTRASRTSCGPTATTSRPGGIDRTTRSCSPSRRAFGSVDPAHIQTVELNYPKPTSSRDDPRWRSVIKLDAAYTYVADLREVLQEYNRKPSMPVFMAEAGYEFEQNVVDLEATR